MTRLLFLLLSVFTIRAQAYTISYIPEGKDNPTGMAVISPSSTEIKAVIIFLHGIGERGDGSVPALEKLAKWGGMLNLYNAVDYFGIRIIAPQTSDEFQHNEINNAIDYAIKTGADPDAIHIVANSLGGFGFAREADKDANLPKRLASIIMIVMGPGAGSFTAQNIAASKTPVWFFTSGDDTKNGTSPDVTRNLFAAVTAAGGNAWLTEFANAGHAALGVVSGAFYTREGEPGAWKMPPAKGTNATHSMYDFILNNRRGFPPKSPTDNHAS